MRKLRASDFQLMSIDNGAVKYFECMIGDGSHLCIEPQAYGYKVSMFDIDGVVIDTPRQVNWLRYDMLVKTQATFMAAVDQANDMWRNYLKNSVVLAQYNPDAVVLA